MGQSYQLMVVEQHGNFELYLIIMSDIDNNPREEFIDKGYVVLKSVFKKDYIAGLREKMTYLSSKNVYEFELLFDKDIENILLNQKLIDTIKKILATKSLLYFSESNIMHAYDPFKITSRYHKDSRDESKDIPYDNEYPIIRVGIYFQNVKNFSGGLKIREKSHKHFIFENIFLDPLRLIKNLIITKYYNLNSLKLGKGINLEIEEGDVVIWNLRTHHAGMSRRLKLFPKLCLWPSIEQLLPSFLFLPFQYDKHRLALFSSFAKNDLKNKNIMNYIIFKGAPFRISKINSNPDLLKKLNLMECKLPY
jgi:ectoine hydroxylase-related dioxygenase (phytanoyl-CoA dioxygenase family)